MSELPQLEVTKDKLLES